MSLSRWGQHVLLGCAGAGRAEVGCSCTRQRQLAVRLASAGRAVLCRAVLCCAVPCRAVPCRAVLRCSRHGTCRVVLRKIVLSRQ